MTDLSPRISDPSTGDPGDLAHLVDPAFIGLGPVRAACGYVFEPTQEAGEGDELCALCVWIDEEDLM